MKHGERETRKANIFVPVPNLIVTQTNCSGCRRLVEFQDTERRRQDEKGAADRSVAYLCAYFAFFSMWTESITLLGMQIYGVSQNNCYCVFNFCLICVF